MNYIKPPPEGAYERERAMEMARPLTPKSERPRKTWGSLAMRVPDKGCPSRRCFRAQGHAGDCYPL